MNKDLFYKQADLLISILPQITRGTDFALHGGTAINFFVRDMPRLSVDIDLTYLRVSSREETMKAISEQLKTISNNISATMPSVQIEEKTEVPNRLITKLFIRRQNSIVKIEPNRVIRGSIFGCEVKDLCKRAEEVFEKSSRLKRCHFLSYTALRCAQPLTGNILGIFSTLCYFLKTRALRNRFARHFLFIL